jgi:glycerol kinase
MLAGIGAGVWTPETAKKLLHIAKQLTPRMTKEVRAAEWARWEDAIGRVKTSRLPET